MTVAVLSDVRLRSAAPSDENLIRSVYAATREDLYLLDPDVRDALLDMQFRAQRRQVLAAHPDAEQYVVLEDGIGVGFLVLAPLLGGIELLQFGINAARRGHGVARSVLESLLDAHRRVVMTVPVRDVAQRALLESAGFDAVPDAAPAPGEVTLAWQAAA